MKWEAKLANQNRTPLMELKLKSAVQHHLHHQGMFREPPCQRFCHLSHFLWLRSHPRPGLILTVIIAAVSFSSSRMIFFYAVIEYFHHNDYLDTTHTIHHYLFTTHKVPHWQSLLSKQPVCNLTEGADAEASHEKPTNCSNKAKLYQNFRNKYGKDSKKKKLNSLGWIPFNPPVILFCYRTQVSLRSDLWVRFSQTEWVRDVWFNLTDVTQADEDTNSILNDNAKRALPGGQRWNQCKWCHLVVAAQNYIFHIYTRP